MSLSSASQIKKKKFEKPPVKVACLSCRNSRVRCDGRTPCGGCALKGKECLYLPSKRGGPRRKRPRVPNPAIDASFDDTTFQQVDTLAVPGAGLRQLDFPVDINPLFQAPSESLSSGSATGGNDSASTPSTQPRTPREPTRVRVYGSDNDILNAYYVFIHQYFPIFPPPHAPMTFDQPLKSTGNIYDQASDEPVFAYQPQSPVTLAISAILALVPPADDPNPSDTQSVLLRRSYAHKFARLAFEAVDADSELIESTSAPSQALQNESAVPNRVAIHPCTPVELESILALLILSIYEYTQRGNLTRMKNRAGQAYTMATNMSLHCLGQEVDTFSEARRRAWWMTFYCICQASIVSTTTPQVIYNDPRFVSPLPSFTDDSEAWSLLMQSQRALLAATQYIIDLNHILRARGNLSQIRDRMEGLDAWVRTVMAQLDAPMPTPPIVSQNYSSESITAESIRCMTRIKLSSARIKTHRFRAFLDIPIFIQKHCDLTCASIQCTESDKTMSEGGTPGTTKLACCSNFSSISSNVSTDPSAYSWIPEASFPFSSFESTTICLQSALTIAQMFDSLPYPNPIYKIDSESGSYARSPSEQVSAQLPRTMPSFACCAMQSSYAMLMLLYRSRAVAQSMSGVSHQPLEADELADELYWGLTCVISAVSNYSMAFEALGGMKVEIEGAFLTAFPPST